MEGRRYTGRRSRGTRRRSACWCSWDVRQQQRRLRRSAQEVLAIQSVKYCRALCQRTHWPAHRASCAAAVGSGGGASTAQAGGRAGTPAEQTLYEAASSGDVVEVRGLVALGVNVDERMRVWRRRSTARRNREGRVEVIKVLELGAKQGGE
jgi:hypothetical protein